METKIENKINLSYLHSVTGGDAAFEKMLLENAIADIQVNMDKLATAWRNKDAVGVCTTAHTLKAVMAIAGMPQLEVLCKKINIAFHDGSFHPEEENSWTALAEGWVQCKPMLAETIAAY
jgi:HPt (histidine-containing phosphotransfer) domain-containing protein